MPVKILMVDGDASALELAANSMSSVQWCELVTVGDGDRAAALLQDQKFDGIILADRIPHVDGFGLIQYLKHSPLNSRVPTVMLTVNDDIDTMRRGFNAGVTFFAVRPSNRERFYRLFNAVRGAMEAERRRYQRLPYRTSVTCRVGDGQTHFVTESREISEGGLSVSPTGGVSPGQVLELEFQLPRLAQPAQTDPRQPRKSMFAERAAPVVGPQKVHATVRYVTTSGDTMGLDFMDLTPAQREVIQHYVSGIS
jgi:DNA-binding response OmpR family regulator